MATTAVAPDIDLPASARSILRSLAEAGTATRPQLADELELSKPTVSDAVALLQRRGLVDLDGVTQGVTGRSAAVCRVSADAGCVLGLDAGSTHIRVRAQTLDGRSLLDEAVSTSGRQRHINTRTISAASKLLTEALDRMTAPVRAVTVAVPTSVSPAYREPKDYRAMHQLLAALSRLTDVDIEVENNVNCAAVGEHRHGAAAGHDTFSYLQIGVKIGLGTIHRNELFRGATAAAGEPARIPFPWAPGVNPEPGRVEQYLGATSLMRRCRQQWRAGSTPPKDTTELFARADAGDTSAGAVVEAHAADVGRLLAAVVCLLDPGLLVLGGGIGQNASLLPGVSRAVAKLAWPTPIASTSLGDQATVLGATALAADRALDELCGPRASIATSGLVPRQVATKK